MRTSVAITLLVATLLMCGSAWADTRLACIAACDATAQACMRTAHETHEACAPAARTACAPKPPAEQFNCLSTELRTCTRTHSDQTEPCRETFKTCYAACGPRPAAQFDFWCELNASPPTGAARVQGGILCGHAQANAIGAARSVHEALCAHQWAIGYSLGCDPLP